MAYLQGSQRSRVRLDCVPKVGALSAARPPPQFRTSSTRGPGNVSAMPSQMTVSPRHGRLNPRVLQEAKTTRLVVQSGAVGETPTLLDSQPAQAVARIRAWSKS